MLEHDVAFAGADGTGTLNVGALLDGKGLGTHKASGAGPAGKAEDPDDVGEVLTYDGGKYQHQRQGGDHHERELLASSYRSSLELAEGLKCQSVAFPLISSGNYQFPKDEALTIALSEVNRFLLTSEMTVYLVVYDRKAVELSGRLFQHV
ncbi:MAG: macro domain-containing protein, partial [Clostridia bacterium]|nr:macro domain-containing protein [Clostridia bacterium]